MGDTSSTVEVVQYNGDSINTVGDNISTVENNISTVKNNISTVEGFNTVEG